MNQMNPKELAGLAIGAYGAMQKYDELYALYKLLMEQKISTETVLEIGSGRGGTLWGWCHLPTTKTAISIDLPGGAFGGGLTDMDKERIENWAIENQSTYLASLDSHDPKTLEEIKNTLLDPIELLFIDGDHTYEGVKKDYEMYSPLVRIGGTIVFHDICEHPPETKCDVKRFWDEVKQGKDFKEFLSEPLSWGGIGVLLHE